MAEFPAVAADIVRDYMREHDVPGVAVALVRDGRILAEAGFGHADLSRDRPATPRTAWPVASLTKSFTALAAMQLVELGRLSLDAPVTEYLPDLVVRDRETAARLTVRRLLSHSGGLGRTGHQDRTREDAVNPYPTRESLVAALDSATLQSEPGQCFSYSNEGYAIVGRIVEVLRGEPLEDCFTRHIFERAGMARSAVRFAEWRAAEDRAIPYAGEGAGPFDSGERHHGYVVGRLNDDYRTFLATGGIVSCAHDLALYQIATMDLASRTLGVSAGGLDQMQSVQFPYGDTGWGYGLGYWVLWSGATKVIGHSGGLPGVSNYTMMIPSERSGAVVLTNRSDRKAFVLAEMLLGEIRGRIWRSAPTEPLPFETRWPKPSASDLAAFEGEYRFRKGPATVRAGEGGVVVHTPSRYDGPDQDIHTVQVGPDTFMSRSLGQSIPFVRDASGRVCRFLHSGYAYERMA
ncbi:MAG: beta-lactamase family protein [Ectothiorhodospiraceae bacterium]|nr:beta-lactamase family protein [Ectothiorhodospiraceae bacterium]